MQAKETAAAAVAKAQEAGKAASSSIAAAVQQANGGAAQGGAEGEGSNQARTWSWSYGSSWFEGAQVCQGGVRACVFACDLCAFCMPVCIRIKPPACSIWVANRPHLAARAVAASGLAEVAAACCCCCICVHTCCICCVGAGWGVPAVRATV
jgi:hypothetical protein